ncbi:MAG TPA: tetratricopeptide repeat protein [Tepidisphaeraceae bacterium]|nr:tetratricopeptide repeat protein [Tepidisphaeraceae bacterium]
MNETAAYSVQPLKAQQRAGSSFMRLHWVGAVAMSASIFICYWPAVHGHFIWDDESHVTENHALHSLNGLARIWFIPGTTPQYYPLTHTSFWIEYHLWELNPTGYHITNILLHCASAILLWRLLLLLEIRGAFVAAAIFALHPVNVESVAWITERKNTLATFFALLSMLCYLRIPDRKYKSSLILFGGALLSKTITSSLPAVLLVIAWWQHGRIEWRRDVKPLIPFFALGLGMSVITSLMEYTRVGAHGPEWALSFTQRLLIASHAICFYAAKLAWPAPLEFSYPRWQVTPTNPLQWIYPATIVLVVGILIWIARRWTRAPLAATLIFIGTLFPALGFINLYPMRFSFVADHFQYLSAPALFASVVAGLAILLQRKPVLRILFAAFLLGSLALLTWRQAHIYQGQLQLWTDTLQKNPSSWLAHEWIGNALKEAAVQDQQAGNAAAAKQKLNEALDHYDASEKLHGENGDVNLARGNALMALGRYNDALAAFRRQLVQTPLNTLAHLKIAACDEQLGRPENAVAELKASLAADPNSASTLLDLGMLLAQLARPAEARPYLERYLQGRPDDAETHVALGYVYGQLQMFDDARREFLLALTHDPNLQTAHQGLALLRQAKAIP